MKHLNIWVFFLTTTIILFFASCCTKDEKEEIIENNFTYPNSKIWAHGVNDTTDARNRAETFEGLELDVVYSNYQNELFIGHDLYDTIHEVTLDMWFAALPEVSKHYYWVDMKNLDVSNASTIATKIFAITQQYGIKDKLLVEHTSEDALKLVKDKGLHVILWVDNLYWWADRDTAKWIKMTKDKIDFLHPEALSCEYRLFPLLPDEFPEQNIHFWHTPVEPTEENLIFRQKMIDNKSVKVVLVD